VDKAAQIELEGEAPSLVGHLGSAEALRGITEALVRFGGPASEAARVDDGDAEADDENEGADA